VRAEPTALEERLRYVAARGVPNYFGPQRFGRGCGNLELARRLFEGERLGRREREFALSAARSWLFNQVLARRVQDGSWDQALDGEVLILDGRGSVFPAEVIDEVLAARVAAGELHPTGPLWGRDGPRPGGPVAALEEVVAAEFDRLAAGLERAGLEMARRSLRLVPRELTWERQDGDWVLGFSLPAGEYATTLVRELLETG
jgi:tRNA pseudouridine13 synthase